MRARGRARGASAAATGPRGPRVRSARQAQAAAPALLAQAQAAALALLALAQPAALALLALASGCASVTPAAGPATPAPPSAHGAEVVLAAPSGNTNPEPLAAVRGLPVLVAWSDVRSSASCFFFSGPRDLGRDDHLGANAALTLEPPGASLVFEGDLRFDGVLSLGALSLVREAPHEFGGTWLSRESIVLTPVGASWVGTYHYDEINPATRAPSSCHIDARVMVAPR